MQTRILITIAAALLLGGVGVWYVTRTGTPAGTTNTATLNTGTLNTGSRNANSDSAVVTTLPLARRVSDSVATLTNPVTVPTYDGKQYFVVGQPEGQNSKAKKKIIFSLPGHGTDAATDYQAWQEQIADHDYALASLNWWDGSGETKDDYYSPEDVLIQVQDFLIQQGYTQNDFIVLEGFSRGSANTYAVISYDVIQASHVFDAVISASGKYQEDFPLAPNALESTSKLYDGVPWILVCGRQDPNPARSGCEGMAETQSFLDGEGAQLLALLEDPNGGHGAFHASPLRLVDQALALLDALPSAR